MKKICCVPMTSVSETPELMSQQVDELLYGDGVEVLGAEGAFSRIRTDYGYEGWVESRSLMDELHEANRVVCVPFADLLCENRNYYRPMLTLPRGARVDVGYSHEEPKYCFAVLPSKRIWYLLQSHVRPLVPEKRSAEETRESIASDALSYLGTQYRWGGRTPAGLDCSGLTFMAYRLNGLTIWRDADPDKNENLVAIPLEEAKKADLLFFDGHIALYLGDGTFVHASGSAGKVCVQELTEEWKKRIVCVMKHKEL